MTIIKSVSQLINFLAATPSYEPTGYKPPVQRGGDVVQYTAKKKYGAPTVVKSLWDDVSLFLVAFFQLIDYFYFIYFYLIYFSHFASRKIPHQP